MPTKNQIKSIPFQYAEAVRNDKIIVGELIKQAVDRFYNWLDNSAPEKFYLDHKKGMQIIDFFAQFLVHTKGKMVGQPFILSPFQQFTLYNLFGWQEYTPEGPKRRINEVYEKIGKKNGKTAVMAGVGLFCMSFDMEAGAEIYVGATKEDQAKLCFNQAVEFIGRSAALRQIGFAVYQKEIKFKRQGFNSSLKPLGGDSKTQDGINCHLAIVEEYHAHKGDSVKENLESSMAARRQPILYHITTAGVNVAGVCKRYEDVCVEILKGNLIDDHRFIMIHDLDEDDDWMDVSNWEKANPNLGVSVFKSFLIKEFNKSKNQPSKIPNFKTKHLNQWVDAPEIWIPSEIWKRNTVEIKDYDTFFEEKAQEFGTYVGLDLSTRKDITAIVYVTEPDNDNKRYIKPYLFCPKDTIDIRSREDAVPYRAWRDAGHLISTPGNSVDYNPLRKLLLSNQFRYNVIGTEVDEWNSHTLVNWLAEDGYIISYFSPAISHINFPTKQFEIMVYSGEINHSGNPMMDWMLSGCVIISDPNDNIKVHKGRSQMGVKRVDGIIATIMALGGSLSVVEESNESRYNDPDFEINFG